MVTFQIMSDLHIENYSEDLCVDDFIIPSAEVLILAGDIGRVHKFDQLEKFLKSLASKFKVILYVLGNHEFYRVEGVPPKTMEEIVIDLETIRSRIPNLYILNRSSVIIEDVCIVGCTLWSRTMVNVPHYIVRIKDMNTVKYNMLYEKDLEYIENMIPYCERKGYRMMVVTHHCPTYSVCNDRKNDRFKSLYCNDLDYILESGKIHTWVCGHVHRNFDLTYASGTRLVCNQMGKPKDLVPTFSLRKLIVV